MRTRALRLAQSSWRSYRIIDNSPKSIRHFSIQPAPSTTELTTSSPTSKDDHFEVLGPNYSLLSVKLSASQPLHTRRGTLVGLQGAPEHAISVLTPLSPLVRAPLGIPWLYQKITSASPVSLLIGAKSPQTSFAVLNLDGRLDWRVVQRTGILAWAGQSLVVDPTADTSLSLGFWGNSTLTGRGLVALAGVGQIYRVHLKEGEQYVAHPGNVLAYSIGRNAPQTYRFKSTSLPIQIPSFGEYLPDTKFVRNIRDSETWKFTARILFRMRTWTRRTVFGDRLFLRFHGETTLLLQSRGSRLRDVLTDRDINEIADSPAGSLQSAVTADRRPAIDGMTASTQSHSGTSSKVSYATVGQSGKVDFTQR